MYGLVKKYGKNNFRDQFWWVQALVTKDLVFTIQFSFSLFKYWIGSLVTEFDDYLDYLEISRFRVWHSMSSLHPQVSNAIKSSREFGIGKSFSFLPTFTKVRTVATDFPYVRGFTWDKGESVDSIEAQLVLGEHYFGAEKYYKFNDFQTYIIDSGSIRQRFLRTESTYEVFIPGFTAKTKVVKGSNSGGFIKIIFLISFFIFFCIFFLLEVLSFGIHFTITKIAIKYNFKETFFYSIFTGCKYIINLFFSLAFYVFKPIFYCCYILGSITFCLLYIVKDIYIIFYLLVSFHFSKVITKILKFRGRYLSTKYKIIKFYFFLLSPKYQILRIVTIGYKAIFFFWKIIRRCFNYSFILKIIMQFLARIFVACLVYKVFVFLWLQTFVWVFLYFVSEWFTMGYYFIFWPTILSLVILVPCIVFPSMRSFLKIHKATMSGDYTIGYEDRRFINMMNTSFYKELSHEPLPFRLQKWELRSEVHDLKRLMDHEATIKGKGRDIFQKDVSGNSKVIIRNKSNSLEEKLALLVDLSVDSRDPSSVKRADSSFVEKSEMASDVEYIFRNSPRFKYDKLEFKLYQKDLVQFYYLSSFIHNNKGSINRVLYYYKDYKELLVSDLSGFNETNFYDFQLPRFVFNKFQFSLYSSKISEFFELILDSGYYINKAVIFPKNRDQLRFTNFGKRSEVYIPKIYNDESSANWNFGFKSSRFNSFWLPQVTNYTIESGTRGSRRSSSWFIHSSPIDNREFRGILDYQIGDNNFRYRNLSMYIQSFRDIDWEIRLSSNSFLSYSFSFISDSEIFPSWVFKNFLFGLLDHSNYQDDFSSWVNHSVFSGLYSYCSYNFSNDFFAYVNEPTLRNDNYYYRTLEYFSYSINSLHTPRGNRVYPKGLRFWRSRIRGATSNLKSLMSVGIADYLYLDSSNLDRRGYVLLRQLEMNYEYQSSYLSELAAITTPVMERYVVREQEKDKNTIMDDLRAILREVFRADHPDDLELRNFKGAEIRRKTKKVEFSDLSWSEQRRWESVRLGQAVFPYLHPNIITEFMGMFALATVLWMLSYDFPHNHEVEEMFRVYLRDVVFYVFFGH